MKNSVFSIINLQSLSLKRLQIFLGETLELNLRKTGNRQFVDLNTRRYVALLLCQYLLIKADILSENEAKKIQIQRLNSGYPYFSHPTLQSNLPALSISHSGAWVACILSNPQNYATIDIEDLTIRRHYKDLSEYAFSDKEQKLVKAEGKIGFLKIWTAKEAIAKCQKKDLSYALSIDLEAQIPAPFSSDQMNIVVNKQPYFLFQSLADDTLIYTIAQKNPGLCSQF